MKYRFLNRKKVKEIVAMLQKQFNCSLDPEGYAFAISEKDKIYIVKKDIGRIGFENLKVNSLGIYFCEIRNNEIRLSIEGSQIIGKTADKNIIEISTKTAREWLSGKDIELDTEDVKDKKGFVILKCGKDFLGCGKLKNNIILNYVPKIRRMNTVI